MRCICCNSVLAFNNPMRVVTTRVTGGDVRNKVVCFPTNKMEEFCRPCLEPIEGINSDLDPASVTYIKNDDSWTKMREDEFTTESYSDQCLDKEFETVDKEYQGWGQLIKLYD